MKLELVAPEQRRSFFFESRAFSKLANFDSKAVSWKDSAFKFEDMLSRQSLHVVPGGM